MSNYVLLVVLFGCFCWIDSKIHHLTLSHDTRRNINLAAFGYFLKGTLSVKLENLTFGEPHSQTANANHEPIGFTFSLGDELLEIMRNHPSECVLQKDREIVSKLPIGNRKGKAVLYIRLNFVEKRVEFIRKGEELNKLRICPYFDCDPLAVKLLSETQKRRKKRRILDVLRRTKTTGKPVLHPIAIDGSAKKISPDKTNEEQTTIETTAAVEMPEIQPKGTVASNGSEVDSEEPDEDDSAHFSSKFNSVPMEFVDGQYSAQFSIRIQNADEEGYYYFYYHNCENFKPHYTQRIPVSYTISIINRNLDSFLSAGETCKPRLYFLLSTCFLMTALFWIYRLRTSKQSEVFRVHHLMSVVVLLKTGSLFFHGVNYYFIAVYGHQQEVWAVIYYLMHLVKGALLFATIILIGTGYTFFKNFLTDKDRHLFLIVIPLQVLDNIALVIIDESELGEASYSFWKQVFIFVDLICCAAIILPVLWSIRHLQEAGRTDGKAMFNLERLKLFRHFYVLVIGYIYLTRIIKYLVVFTVPFQYAWLTVLLEEVGTWFFFVITGYKFSPAPNNPYLRLTQDDDDDDMDQPLTRSGVLESVHRVKRITTRVSSDGGNDGSDDDVLFNRNSASVTLLPRTTLAAAHPTRLPTNAASTLATSGSATALPPPEQFGDGAGPDIY